LVVGFAQNQLILGNRPFHFAVNSINHLESVRTRRFWANANGSKHVLRAHRRTWASPAG
jgi:hypothetical protein